MAYKNTYETTATIQPDSLKFIFSSNGPRTIQKAIEYKYIQQMFGTPVYNLAFGEYDVDTATLSDMVISGNGDPYAVFHTVLSTVPEFFKEKAHALIMVQGSDSDPEYPAICRQTCRKKCETLCKNVGRRIATYRGFVNKNFEDLKLDYVFYGGVTDAAGEIDVERYQPGKTYDTIFCKKK